MLKRNWIIVAALGLIFLSSLGQAQEEAQPEQGQAAEQQQQPQALPLPFPVKVVEDEAAAEARERSEAESQRREEQDLAAQQGMNLATQDMNKATQRMADLAGWQTWLIGIGTILLTVTLLLTLQANRAAVAGAKAAADAVRATEDIGHRQLRAYVGVHSVDPPEPDPNGKWIKAKVEFRNAGQTPALKLRVSTNIILEPPPFDEAWNAQRLGSSGTLLPNGPIFQTAELRGDSTDQEARLDPQDVHKLFSGDQSVALWVCGKVTYSDIFDKEHWTTFRYIMSKRAGQSAVFTACTEGNETDD